MTLHECRWVFTGGCSASHVMSHNFLFTLIMFLLFHLLSLVFLIKKNISFSLFLSCFRFLLSYCHLYIFIKLSISFFFPYNPILSSLHPLCLSHINFPSWPLYHFHPSPSSSHPYPPSNPRPSPPLTPPPPTSHPCK